MILSESQNKVAAVIPFFNEELHIQEVVNQVLNFVDLIILVNDGSTDNSLNLIPNNNSIILLHHNKNLGKGAALKSGFIKSIELNTKFVVTMDADFQHDSKIIPKFLSKLEQFDCVIGNRNFSKNKMPFHRKLSNFLTSKLLSVKTGYKILDSQSGFRAFRTNILSEILPVYSGFEAESEMIVKISKKKLKLGFLSIPTIYNDNVSKMKALPTILGFVKVILKT